MLTRHARKLLSLTAVVALAACTDNSITDPFSQAAGTYQLTVYAGKSIPANYVIQAGDPNYPQYPNGATFVVTGGSIVLSNNGTFVETNSYTTTPTGQSPISSSFVSHGTWTMTGTDLFLTAPAQNQNGARNVQGTLIIDTINYQEDNGVGGFDSFEYKR